MGVLVKLDFPNVQVLDFPNLNYFYLTIFLLNKHTDTHAHPPPSTPTTTLLIAKSMHLKENLPAE